MATALGMIGGSGGSSGVGSPGATGEPAGASNRISGAGGSGGAAFGIKLDAGSRTQEARAASQRAWRKRAGPRRKSRSPSEAASTTTGTCHSELSRNVSTRASSFIAVFLSDLLHHLRQLGELLGGELAGLDQAQDQAFGGAVEHPLHEVADRLARRLDAAHRRLIEVGTRPQLPPDLPLAEQDVQHRLDGVVRELALRGELLLDGLDRGGPRLPKNLHDLQLQGSELLLLLSGRPCHDSPPNLLGS